MKYIGTPHLPQGKVGLLAIGGRYCEKLAEPLRALGIETIWLPDNPNVDARLAGHADLSVLHLGDKKLIAAGQMNVNILTNREFTATKAVNKQSADYPGDISLNACIVGKHLFHKLKHTDPAVTGQFELVNVNQGYTKCSVCILSDHAIITSDAGIAKSASLCGIEALLIKEGSIELAGFDHGFIGGAAFKISKTKLAFTGTLDKHPDKAAILEFMQSHGIEPVFLTNEPLFDIGSAIPLIELL